MTFPPWHERTAVKQRRPRASGTVACRWIEPLPMNRAEHGDPLATFDYFTVAIGNYHDSGNTYMIRTLLGILAAFFNRLGRYELAATIAGFGVTSPVAALPAMAEFRTAIAHLRNLLGEATYESLARKGESMTTAAMVAYSYDQID
jgi:hypothetical protein